MRLVLESEGPVTREAEAWFHRAIWGCFNWLQVMPSRVITSDDTRCVTVPVRRPIVTGPGFGKVLGLFGSSFTPDRMEYVPARLIVRSVVNADLKSVGPLPEGWVQLDAPISMDRQSPGTVLIGMTSWPKSDWMLKITVERLNIEFFDDQGQSGQ